MPITGIPLPFVTHGGASLVSLAIGLGIIQSINIRQTAPSGDARARTTPLRPTAWLADRRLTPVLDGTDDRSRRGRGARRACSVRGRLFVAIVAGRCAMPVHASPSSSRRARRSGCHRRIGPGRAARCHAGARPDRPRAGPRVRGRLSARLRRTAPACSSGSLLLADPGRARVGGGRRHRAQRAHRPGSTLAFIVGAIVSATDPASVIATFKRLAPRAAGDPGGWREPVQRRHGRRRLHDRRRGAATGSVGAARRGRLVRRSTVAMSTGLGLVAGYRRAPGHGRRRRPPRSSWRSRSCSRTAATCWPTASVNPAIIATVVAGLVLGNVRARVGLKPATFDALDTDLGVRRLPAHGVRVPARSGWRSRSGGWSTPSAPIASASSASWSVGRSSSTWSSAAGRGWRRCRGLRAAVPAAWLHVLFWAGLRGAMAVGLALSLPADIPQRELPPDDRVRRSSCSRCSSRGRRPAVLRRLAAAGRAVDPSVAPTPARLPASA